MSYTPVPTVKSAGALLGATICYTLLQVLETVITHTPLERLLPEAEHLWEYSTMTHEDGSVHEVRHCLGCGVEQVF